MPDPVVLLKKDHREAEAMLKTLAASKPGARRRSTLEKLDAALRLHMEIEEADVYPLVNRLLKQKLDRADLMTLGDEVAAAKKRSRRRQASAA
jgi:hypothetical protein